MNGALARYTGDDGGRFVNEAHEYLVPRPDSAPAATQLCVSYRGAVPVFAEPTAFDDWKGRITAINGSLRASEQTRWYPTLFDSALGRDEQTITFQLTVICPGCRAIYMNGAGSTGGGTRRLASTVPRQLMLYADDFAYSQSATIGFVGGAASAEAQAAFGGAVSEIAAYYSRLLGVPHREPPTMLTFRSVSRDRPRGRNTWQFVTWPTIAMDGGLPFDSLVVRRGGRVTIAATLWTTLSHEMAHYYFGTLTRPVGPMRWFVLESMAEYLSLKAVTAMRGKVAGTARFMDLAGALGSTPLPPLSQVTEMDQVTPLYGYQYAPAALHLLEWRVGEEPMMKFLRNLLALPADAPIAFADVAAAAEGAGIPRAEWQAGWNAQEIVALARREARIAIRSIGSSADDTAGVIAIATTLANTDTARTDRMELLQILARLTARDSTLLRAHYQIGKLGALTGDGLGAVLEHRGRVADARAAYERGVRLEPANTEIRRARDRLAATPPRPGSRTP